MNGKLTGYVLSTWWVLKQNTQHGPTGSILITFVIRPQFTHPNTHQVHVECFQKVPTTEPAEGGPDLPTGSILIIFTFRPHFAHPDTHRAHCQRAILLFQILTFHKAAIPTLTHSHMEIALPSLSLVLLFAYDLHTKTNTDKKDKN